MLMDLWLSVMGERVDKKGSIRAFGGQPERNIWAFFLIVVVFIWFYVVKSLRMVHPNQILSSVIKLKKNWNIVIGYQTSFI